jgi:dsRNA-specific ribonuclease
MAVSVEAIIGAAYLDGDLDAAKRMISTFGLN